MGEAATGWTSGVQRPLLAAARVRPRLFEVVPTRADGRVDIVPADYVADALVCLIDRPEAGVFNLVAGHDAATVDQLAELACAHFDRRGRRSSSRAPDRHGDADEHGAVYFPYFDMHVVFDDARARTVLGSAASGPKLADYFATLMRYAERARWGKRELTREEAAEQDLPAAA
jgi:nucleoside-diphosphate-sugar epimerase